MITGQASEGEHANLIDDVSVFAGLSIGQGGPTTLQGLT